MESGGPEAAELQRIMKEGQLVPDSTMITLLKVRHIIDCKHDNAICRWEGGRRCVGSARSAPPRAAPRYFV